MKPFVIGDRVRHRVLRRSGVIESFRASRWNPGETVATIRRDEPADIASWYVSDLEHVSDDRPKFKCGDRVKFKVGTKRYRVTRVDGDRICGASETEAYGFAGVPEDQLEHVPADPWAPIPDTGSNPVNANSGKPVEVKWGNWQDATYGPDIISGTKGDGPDDSEPLMTLYVVTEAEYRLLQQAKRFRDAIRS